jgi:hypothetical protein
MDWFQLLLARRSTTFERRTTFGTSSCHCPACHAVVLDPAPEVTVVVEVPEVVVLDVVVLDVVVLDVVVLDVEVVVPVVVVVVLDVVVLDVVVLDVVVLDVVVLDVEVVVPVVVVVVVPPPTTPVHTVPFRVNEAGTGLLEPLTLPLNPKLAVPPVASAAFQATLATRTSAPDWLSVPFQSCVMVWPAPKVQSSRQPFSASPRLVTVTLTPNPPGQLLPTA